MKNNHDRVITESVSEDETLEPSPLNPVKDKSNFNDPAIIKESEEYDDPQKGKLEDE